MKNSNSGLGPRRALPLLLSVSLGALLVLVSVQFLMADDDIKPTPTPDLAPYYADTVLSDSQLRGLEPSLDRYIAGHLLTQEQLLGPEIGGSTKEVDKDEVPAGAEVQYTIVLSNSGDADVQLSMTDTLPAELSLLSYEMKDQSGTWENPGFSVDGNELLWGGWIVGGGYAEIGVVAQVHPNVAPDTMIVNTAVIHSANETISPSASVKVLETLIPPDVQLPFVTFDFKPEPPPITSLSSTRPNSLNEFTVSWTSGPGATNFEVQMADNPAFDLAQVHQATQTTSLLFNPPPSYRNVHYFRVRSQIGPLYGEWSETIQVVGAYRDDFRDEGGGWAIRRTTHIDDVNSWYETQNGDGWLILQVHDRWDWGISSPLMPAPEPPYVIEVEMQIAHHANGVSQGVVFGGDKPGETCPDKSSVEGWYQHSLCFNHFYNTNYIWYGPIKLLFEQVNELVWCPNCGGSPMKRSSDHTEKDPVPGIDSDEWNRVRIEVRDGDIDVYSGRRGGELKETLDWDDTRWIGSPYFGVFASTDEYNNSTMRVEYYAVTPLDN